ncbi:hypothetical protein C1H76_0618 [Elsinoe australis]|uniref:Rrn9 domain-containing protein n=1 Tax=Elsinoe australis TaxID=40998 RepID=A0A4U7BAI7_9PEZI|nr:hypothetical protein C1H76_0618 [Elsinoe australis]
MSLFGGGSPPTLRQSESGSSVSPIPSHEQEESNTRPEDVFTHVQTDSGHLDSDQPVPSPSDPLTAVDAPDVQEELERDRFPGSDSLWRYYARDAIPVAKALEYERANDLSAHLFNTHTWKRSSRKATVPSPELSLTRKDAWLKTDDSDSRPWYPTTPWTAWPLQPDLAPDPVEAFWGRSNATHDHTDTELKQQLAAGALRFVKRQWNSRATAGQESSIPKPRSPSQSRSRTPSVAPPGSDQPEEDNIEDCESQTDPAGPVLSANVGRSDKLLHPIVSSVQRQLDDLLMALHHNRAGHYAVGRGEDSTQLRRSSLSRSRSTSLGAAARWRRASASPAGSDPDDQERNDRPNKRQKISERQERDSSVASTASSGSGSDGEHSRAPRDWSEVLGIAALTGWDANAIERARIRCQDLFGEFMMFRTLEAGAPGEDEDASAGSSSFPLDLPIFDAAKGYYCPYPDCVRHTNPFPPSRAFRFREHLQRKHKLSRDQIQQIEARSGSVSRGKSSVSQKNPRGWVPPDPLCCPHTDCPQTGKVYPEPRRLVEHLKRAHKYDPRTESPPAKLRPGASAAEASDAGSESDALSQADDFMVGGIHNDGFLIPIGTNKWRRVALWAGKEQDAP